jgi:hypothetical protein
MVMSSASRQYSRLVCQKYMFYYSSENWRKSPRVVFCKLLFNKILPRILGRTVVFCVVADE